MRFAQFVVPALLLCAMPAYAAETETLKATTQPANAAAVEEALRMLDAGEFESQVLTSTDVVVEAMLAVEVDRLQKEMDEPLPAELLASFRMALLDHAASTMKSKMADMKRQAAEIYAREFTVEELRRMREIETDPVMVKARAKSETLSAQLMMVGVQAMRESEGDLKSKIEQIVHEYLKDAGLLADEKS